MKVRQLSSVNEAGLLSTCNRVEIYLAVGDRVAATEAVNDFISNFHNIERREFETSLYVYNNSEAVRHVFRVASSLDSMIVPRAGIWT